MNHKVPRRPKASSAVTERFQEAIRERVRHAVDQSTVREVARRAGVSHVTLLRLLAGEGSIRGSTLKQLEEWLERPGEREAVGRLRRDLKRLLGALPAAVVRRTERELAALIRRAYNATGVEPPEWVDLLG